MFCMKICLNLVYPQEHSIYFCIYNFLFKWIRYQSVFKGNKGFQYRISGNFRENLIFAFYAITYILQKIQYAEIISRIFNFAIFSANFFDIGKKLRIYGISMYFLKKIFSVQKLITSCFLSIICNIVDAYVKEKSESSSSGRGVLFVL